MDENRIYRKCAWRLVPFAVLLFIVNYIDRTNVGFAALTMNRDLGFSPAVYGFGAGVFFISYFLCQVPANFMIQRIGARRGMFIILATWGLISASNALVRSAPSFYALRFLLGLAEAGFWPGMFFYLTQWFPQAWLARTTAGFNAAIPLSFVVGGPLASVILGMDGTFGLHGWQWLFLAEGLPAFVIAFAALKFLPNGPADASWLNEAEKSLIAAHLTTEQPAGRSDFWPVLRDWRVIGLGLALTGSYAGLYGVALWIPQIMQGIGFSIRATGLIVAIPYLFAALAMVGWARSSDRRRERLWHAILALLLAATGFAAASAVESNLVMLIALTCTAVGVLSVFAPFDCLVKLRLSGAAVASGFALCNAVGSLGGFAGPYVIGAIRQATGSYAPGMAAISGYLLLCAALLFLLGRESAPSPTAAPVPAQ